MQDKFTFEFAPVIKGEASPIHATYLKPTKFKGRLKAHNGFELIIWHQKG